MIFRCGPIHLITEDVERTVQWHCRALRFQGHCLDQTLAELRDAGGTVIEGPADVRPRLRNGFN